MLLQEKCKEDEEAEGECQMGGAGAGAGGKPLVADKITFLVVESAPLTLAGAGGGRPLQLVAYSLPIVLIVNVSQVREQHSTVLCSEQYCTAHYILYEYDTLFTVIRIIYPFVILSLELSAPQSS